jgi:hypothetical protein
VGLRARHSRGERCHFCDDGGRTGSGGRFDELSHSTHKLAPGFEYQTIMNRRYDLRSYPASCFDDDFCLKPPVLLWVAVLFLSRGAVLPIFFGVGRFAGIDADSLSLLQGLWRIDTVIPAIFAAPVLYSLMRRVASASGSVRWIWSRGRVLLAVSAFVDLALNVVSLRNFSELGDAFPVIGAGIADAYFLLYFLAARRIRDTFSDFPPPLRSA